MAHWVPAGTVEGLFGDAPPALSSLQPRGTAPEHLLGAEKSGVAASTSAAQKKVKINPWVIGGIAAAVLGMFAVGVIIIAVVIFSGSSQGGGSDDTEDATSRQNRANREYLNRVRDSWAPAPRR